MYNDDDQESLSTHKALERADHGRQDSLDQRKKMAKDRLALQKKILQHNIALANRPDPGRDDRTDDTLAYFDRSQPTVEHSEESERQTSATRLHTNQDLQRKEEQEKRDRNEAKQESQQEMG